MTRLRKLQPLIMGIALLLCFQAFAKPAFNSSEIEGPGSDLIFCDFAGDNLKNAVLLNGTNVSVFFQDAKQGFSRKPQLEFILSDQPALVCSARLGRKAESLLLMTSDGVTELDIASHTNPPTRRQIIRQKTIVPAKLDETQSIAMPFSANTSTDWPLLLVPAANGLQVWQYRDQWRLAQTISDVAVEHLQVSGLGYARSVALSLCLDDVNGDGRDDLMTMRMVGEKQIYTLYLQNTNGLFNLEPALIYTNTDNWHTALSWKDINRDGKLDLIKSTSSDEPSFVPGLQSSKVLVAIYRADEHGRIPATPQQVFRKADWSAFLPMVDVDGDGFMDMVLGYIPIDSREQVHDVVTSGQINLNLKIHYYRPGVGFPSEPDWQRNLPIYFDEDINWTWDNRIYSEKFLSLDGDFNGDGKKDLLVRDSHNEISAYFFHSRETGFSLQADLKFSCPDKMDSWQIVDLNGDGLSDLVVKLRNKDAYRIFISLGK